MVPRMNDVNAFGLTPLRYQYLPPVLFSRSSGCS